MRTFGYVAMAFMLALGVKASAADTLKVKFRSRALLDATASGYGKEDVQGSTVLRISV